MTAKILRRASGQWPQLVATAFICWSLGTASHDNMASKISPIQSAQAASEAKHTAVSSGHSVLSEPDKNLQVLTNQDEESYRQIFAAQQKMDWVAADTAIAQLKDKRLMGHVLADRYEKRGATPEELRRWLDLYASLPQADDMYEKARSLPLQKGKHFAQPIAADYWAGGASYGASLGFRTENADSPSSAGQHFLVRMNAALRRGEPGVAKGLFDAERMHRNISADELADLQSRIAAGYYYEGEVVAARNMVSDVLENKNPLGLWIYGLSAWRQSDASGAAEAFSALAMQTGLSSWDRAAADYWAYRATKRAGNTSTANYWLKQAAQQPHSFYGFLASNLLGQDNLWAWTLPVWNRQSQSALAAQPAGWRALALLQIGQNTRAEMELRHLNPQGQRGLQNAMLALAEKTHLPALAMQLGGVATNDNGQLYDAALYPVPPWQPRKGFDTDRALIYALIRHESHFNPDAISGSGACGLMQLMPMTAHLISNDNKAPSDECSDHLLEPVYNIEIGQKYVERLARQPMIGDNLLFLLAAYNSGPNKVAHWTEDFDSKDPLLFIESIPVRETRDYVQQVMIHYWTYRARLNQPETSLSQLAHGQWPRYVLRDRPSRQIQNADSQESAGFRLASNQE